MSSKRFSCAILFTCLWGCRLIAAGVPLNAAQEDRAHHLYQLFTSPCCWLQCVAEHQSPEAAKLRGEIDGSIAAGQTDSEIKTGIVREYGRAILLVPDGITGIFVFAVPALAVLSGTLLVLLYIRAKTRRKPPISNERESVDFPDEWREYFDSETGVGT